MKLFTLFSLVTLVTVSRRPAVRTTLADYSDSGIGVCAPATQGSATRRLAKTNEPIPHPNKLDNPGRMAMLNLHNLYRSITAQGNTPNQPGAQYMEKLMWDTALEKVATAHAQKCLWHENNDRDKQYAQQKHKAIVWSDSVELGENRYFEWAGAEGNATSDAMDVLLRGIDQWYMDHEHYSFSSDKCNGPCGVYKQLVYDATRYVGCGFSVCPRLTKPFSAKSWPHATFLVCNYAVIRRPGRPYIPVTPLQRGCSRCPSDREICDNELCSGCPATAFYKCVRNKDADCNQLPRSQLVSSPSCSPLNPLGRKRFRTTLHRLPAVVSPKTVPQCSGITISASWTFESTSATCTDFKKALRSYKPCIPFIQTCSIAALGGRNEGSSKVTMVFTTSPQEARTVKNWKAGLKKILSANASQ